MKARSTNLIPRHRGSGRGGQCHHYVRSAFHADCGCRSERLRADKAKVKVSQHGMALGIILAPLLAAFRTFLVTGWGATR